MRLIYPVTITPSEQPDIRQIAPGHYMLNEDFSVIFWSDAEVCTLRVPSGYESDGTSIHWWLWEALRLNPNGICRTAALVHAYMCEYRGVYTNASFCGTTQAQLPSKVAHELFGELMEVSGVSPLRAKLMPR